ncbi:Alpha/Beta hydrolase protein [Roridomyces roridus]|uniref:Alpha/Beta hydrolase protein n=1 Tax=Roridomyces roridus TaxID=1738132 RepID=A0AAD7BM01_9AGAR|nr:Alpha/Beta hydrolase protein [Roridomyces roridus]
MYKLTARAHHLAVPHRHQAMAAETSLEFGEHGHLAVPDPEFAPFIDFIDSLPQRSKTDMGLRRKQFEDGLITISKQNYGVGLPKESEYIVKDEEIDVAGSPAGKIRVRTLVPASSEEGKTYPLYVWFHGGGWTTGNVDMDDYQLRQLCVELQLSIVNVEYRLAPEHPTPIIQDDCYAGIKWAVENQVLLSADVKKGFLIGGLSAGGHLTAVLAHRARDDPWFEGRPITGQILQIPALCHPEAVPDEHKSSLFSFKQNEFATGLPAADVHWLYKQLGGSPTSPDVSPFLHPVHAGLPPAVLQICGLDPLRDEALLYGKILKKEGVKTRVHTYPGVPHGFNYGFPNISAAKRWEREYREGLRWILEGAPQA